MMRLSELNLRVIAHENRLSYLTLCKVCYVFLELWMYFVCTQEWNFDEWRRWECIFYDMIQEYSKSSIKQPTYNQKNIIFLNLGNNKNHLLEEPKN